MQGIEWQAKVWERKKNFFPTILEILALLDCIAQSIVLALA